MLRRLLAAGWGQLVAGLLTFLSLRLFSDLLGPSDFGVAMLAMGAVSLLDGISSAAFAQVLGLAMRDNAERQERLRIAFGLSRYFRRWLAGLCGAGVILSAWWFGWKEAGWLAAASLVFVASEGPRVTGQTAAMLDRRFTLLSSWSALDALSTLGVSLAAIWLTAGNPVAVPLGMLLGRSLVTALMILIAIGGPDNWQADAQAARLELPRALQLGWSVAVMAPLGWLGLFADRYIINATTGIVAAGVIAALAGAVTRPFSITSAALTNVFRPELLDAVAGRKGRFAHPLRNWLLAAALIGLAGTAAFALIGNAFAAFIIKFPTPGIDRGLILVLLSVSQLFVLMTHAVDNELLAHGMGKTLLATQIGVMVLGLPIIVIGAQQAGAEGAAAGRIVNELLKLMAVCMVLALRRRGQASMKSRQGV